MSARTAPSSLLVVLAVVSVQFGNAASGSFFDLAGPLGAAALRLTLGATILVVLVRPRIASWDRGTWLGAIALGAGLAGMNTSIYLAIDRIPIGVAVTVELLGPLAVAAAGIRRTVDGLWVLVALCGVVLLGATAGGGASSLGLLFACGAAAFWALYIVAASRLGPRAAGFDGIAVAMVVAAVLSAPLGWPQALPAVVARPWLLLVFAAIALATSAVPYALEFAALRRMSPRVFGVLSSLGPAMAAVAGLVVLGQRLDAVQLAAIALVVVASVGVMATARPRRSGRGGADGGGSTSREPTSGGRR
ncbi:MAG: EamA family transporter [Mycetocola reblochoni]|uniref:EamA family transporter n=2 Tax=Mycetocola reblochoni TaxID=331618 RepID=A0A3L6ZUD0_9MICO|nr:EamA family transporter [Mycetocola reblochoni]RLP71161.1 EamA family transporter [Mycetocola reblochoni]SJN40986.1 putative integral membrane protein [Mycetocola reblochoni REB411]